MNIDKLEKWVKKNFNLQIDIKLGDYFEYYYYEDLITISKDVPPHFIGYLRYCNKLGLNKYIDPGLIAFLHELGHKMTIDSYMGFLNEAVNRISFILDIPSHTQILADIKSWLHYRVPVEREATLWAIDYINNNDISDLENIWKEFADD